RPALRLRLPLRAGGTDRGGEHLSPRVRALPAAPRAVRHRRCQRLRRRHRGRGSPVAPGGPAADGHPAGPPRGRAVRGGRGRDSRDAARRPGPADGAPHIGGLTVVDPGPGRTVRPARPGGRTDRRLERPVHAGEVPHLRPPRPGARPPRTRRHPGVRLTGRKGCATPGQSCPGNSVVTGRRRPTTIPIEQRSAPHMIIEQAEVIVTSPDRNFVTLKLTTDDGLTGLGDATLNGRELAVVSYLKEHVVPLLLGRDAHRIEDTWQFLYRSAYWRRGPVTMAAVAAVDTALWDIKGKAAGMPVYQLLGGASRDG